MMKKNNIMFVMFGGLCFFLGIMATFDFVTKTVPVITVYEFLAVVGVLCFVSSVLILEKKVK